MRGGDGGGGLSRNRKKIWPKTIYHILIAQSIYLSIHLLNYIQPMPYDLSPLCCCCCCCFILIYWMSLTYDQWVCVCEGALLLLLLLIPFTIPINQQTRKQLTWSNICLIFFYFVFSSPTSISYLIYISNKKFSTHIQVKMFS